MKESTFYYLMQESKIESECSDNKGEEYPSAFADKYNTYYQYLFYKSNLLLNP